MVSPVDQWSLMVIITLTSSASRNHFVLVLIARVLEFTLK